jgi:signal transduction histidine kinase
LAAPQYACETAVKTDIRLSDIVQEVVELVSPSLRHRRIALSVVNQIEVGATLQADAGQLRQLLVNLVLNGADAAGPSGHVTIAIETALEEKLAGSPRELSLLPPHILLRVSDNGPGPAPEIAKRLFEPFVTDKPEGIGLGLAVSQQIARSHGGSIFFSRQNGETTVEVHFPLTVSDSSCQNGSPDSVAHDLAGIGSEATAPGHVDETQ